MALCYRVRRAMELMIFLGGSCHCLMLGSYHCESIEFAINVRRAAGGVEASSAGTDLPEKTLAISPFRGRLWDEMQDY